METMDEEETKMPPPPAQKYQPPPEADYSNIRRSQGKKVSLVIWGESSYDSTSESDMFSESSGAKLVSFTDLPDLPLKEELIAMLFDTPSPFLINLAMALFLKHALATRSNPWPASATITLLTLSTMVAYKISHDESMEGMIEYYSGVLRVGQADLIALERWFLETLNYEVTVSGRYYYEVMRRVMNPS